MSMPSNTVDNPGELSTISTSTGGRQANASRERLEAAYPGSPIFRSNDSDGNLTSLNSVTVALQKSKLLTNSVIANDQSNAQSYYATATPAEVDLSYSGAPNIPEIGDAPRHVLGDLDYDLPVSVVPILAPPISLSPIRDNEDNAANSKTSAWVKRKISRPPFITLDNTNPAKTSAEIKDRLTNLESAE